MKTSELIADIERLAAEMAPDSSAARKLIVDWSAFTGRKGDLITVANRPWKYVSDGWLTQIHRKAVAANAEWKKKNRETLPLFDAGKSRAPLPDPTKTDYDNGADLPF